MSTERAIQDTNTAGAPTGGLEPTPRTRRALLGGLIGGLGAFAASALGRHVPGVDAAAGGNLVLGAANSAGSSQTVLTSTAGGAAFTLKDAASGGTGIFGWSSATSGAGRGLYGRTDSPDGIGLHVRQLGASAGAGSGIHVQSDKNAALTIVMSNPAKDAVTIEHTGAGVGGKALVVNSTTVGIDVNAGAGGVRAVSAQTAIFAESTTAVTAIYGTTADGTGVVGNSTSNYGVAGTSTNSNGVFGSSSSGTGIRGTGPLSGVKGETTTGAGVWGVASSGIGGAFSTSSYRAVDGYATPVGDGVVGTATNGWSGLFTIDARVGGVFQVGGDCQVEGSLSKAGGSFKIDHPLDPSGKYLMHSFVESPDMLNIYNGVAVLDARGEATVAMPGYFEALNRDFRYQLTALGRPAPDLHVRSELSKDRFTIAGGAANQRVSWQVTGVRRDAWANANRIPVEVAKAGAERGTFLHPEVHGQPASKRVPARHPVLAAPEPRPS